MFPPLVAVEHQDVDLAKTYRRSEDTFTGVGLSRMPCLSRRLDGKCAGTLPLP
jgi:hypothetical protein